MISAGVYHPRSSASCVGWQSPDTGTTKAKTDGVVSRIVKPTDVGIGEVLDHREGRYFRRDPWQGDGSEILLEVAQQRVANSFAEEHPPGDDHSADRAVGRLAQQQTDVRDDANVIDSYRYRVDVDERHVGADVFE